MNLGEHRQALLDDLSLESTDTFLTTAILNRFINRAVGWVADRKNWQQTQRGVMRSSEANQEYYNYPENYKSDSIERLTLDGNTHVKRTFVEYEKYKEENPTGTKKIFADYRNRYFINPAPTTDGTNNIKLWIHEKPDTLSADADEHPFIDEQDLEEAIHLYALHLCYRKQGGSMKADAKSAMDEAKVLVEEVWNQQVKNRSNEQTEVAEQFEHTDFLADNTDTKRGSFQSC